MRSVPISASFLCVCAVSGCLKPVKAPVLNPIPMYDAIAIVNDNAGRISGTLRAIGHVDGTARTAKGRTVSFNLDGTLFYLAPTFVRLDLKHLGQRKLLLGMNAADYWYYDGEKDEYQCRRLGQQSPSDPPMPLSPTQLIEAIGLGPIGMAGAKGNAARPVQRVVADYQQILWLDSSSGGGVLQKEFWLDRRAPRLVRRVVFRDAQGNVEMESELSDHRALPPGGAILPYVIETRWPKTDARLRFRVTRWELHEGIGTDAIQFATPSACGGP